MTVVMRDDAELFMDNDSFKRWMTDTVFSLATSLQAHPERKPCSGSPGENAGTIGPQKPGDVR